MAINPDRIHELAAAIGDDVKAIEAAALKKSGGEMTGALKARSGEFGIQGTSNTSYVKISGGTGPTSTEGAQLCLGGNASTSTNIKNGGFMLRASNGSDSYALKGSASGSLTWGEETVLTSAGGEISGGISSSSDYSIALTKASGQAFVASVTRTDLSKKMCFGFGSSGTYYGVYYYGGEGSGQWSLAWKDGYANLYAQAADGTRKALIAGTTGTLTWDGNPVVTSNEAAFTGNVSSSTFFKKDQTSYQHVGVGSAYNDAPSLSFYGMSYSTSSLRGQFRLRSGADAYQLIGTAAGKLTWGGADLLTTANIGDQGYIDATDTHVIKDCGTQYLRFNNGLMICWGTASPSHTFAQAFYSTPWIVLGQSGTGDCYTLSKSKTQVTVNSDDSGPGSANYIAIGRWKA